MQEIVPIKLGIVDDHVLFRKGLRGLIESISNDYLVIFEASNGQDLQVRIYPDNLPDIIIMDVNMPKMNGFESVSWLKEAYPRIKVLVVSMIEKEEVIVKMIKLGVKGYLCKDVEPKELNEALQAIMKKDYYYTDYITGKLVHSLQNEDTENSNFVDYERMNDKEKEFIQLVCSELTYREIASKMFLSPKTIDGYRSALFEKLDVKNRVGLAMYAVKNEWVKL